MFNPAFLQSIELEQRVTPSGRKIPVNSERNRTNVAAAFLAGGDESTSAVMSGFWLLAIALDPTTKAFEEMSMVSRRLNATYEHMERHCCMAVSMRIKVSQPQVFRTIATGPSIRTPS